MITKQYLAGFMDGEGCIGLYKHKDNRTKNGFTISALVSIGNTDKSLLNEIQKLSNGVVVDHKHKNNNAKMLYNLQIQNHQDIISFLELIYPYLILKKEQAKLMIDFCKKRVKSQGKTYTQSEINIVDKFRELNKRGER